MSGKNMNFKDKKIKVIKVIFTKTKKTFNIDEIGVDKILVPKR